MILSNSTKLFLLVASFSLHALPSQALAAPSSTKRVWTAKQIVAERKLQIQDKENLRYCQGGLL